MYQYFIKSMEHFKFNKQNTEYIAVMVFFFLYHVELELAVSMAGKGLMGITPESNISDGINL